MLLIASCTAAAGTGVWKNFTSMKDVRGIARSGSMLWAATSGGLFRWDEGKDQYLRFTSADGLQNIDLTAAGADAAGDIWAGTSTGLLYVYSPATGSLLTVTDIATYPGQTQKKINALAPAGDTLLISSDFGLSVYRRGQKEFGDTFTKFGSYPSNVRIAVAGALVSGGRIWASVTDGLTTHRVASASLSSPNLLEPTAWTLWTVGGPGSIPLGLAEFQGRVYAGTTSGLYWFDGGAWQPVASLAGKSIVGISAGSSLTACTTAGEVWSVDGANNGTLYGTALPWTATSVSSTADGRPVIGSLAGGILTFSGSWASHFPDGPNANAFTSVVIDPSGALWGASGESSGKGMYRYDGTRWRSFTMSNSPLPMDEMYRVSVGCNGSIWASAYGGGIVEIPAGATAIDASRVYGNNVGMVGIVQNQAFVVTSTVACDSRGNVWTSVVLAADRNVLAVRTPGGTWRTLPLFVGGAKVGTLMDRPVDRCLAVDASDNLWAVVRDPGEKGVVSLRNRGTIDSVAAVHITSANGLPSDDVKTIIVDKENDIWVGTDRGIAIILDPDNPLRQGGIAAYKPLAGVVINAIAVDPLNQKWIGTSEGAVLYSADGTQQLASYTVENTGGKLIDNDVRSVTVDPASGTVYFGTAYGLASLTTAAAEPKIEFDKLLAYPNPYRVPSSVPVTIDGLTANASIKILTIDGTLVRELKSPGGRIGFWDGRDERGRVVASGIYLVVGYSEDGSQTGKGKLAVIRQ